MDKPDGLMAARTSTRHLSNTPALHSSYPHCFWGNINQPTNLTPDMSALLVALNLDYPLVTIKQSCSVTICMPGDAKPVQVKACPNTPPTAGAGAGAWRTQKRGGVRTGRRGKPRKNPGSSV